LCEAKRRHAGGLRSGASVAIVFRFVMSVMGHEGIEAALGYET
jgi:hypothetical protein